MTDRITAWVPAATDEATEADWIGFGEVLWRAVKHGLAREVKRVKQITLERRWVCSDAQGMCGIFGHDDECGVRWVEVPSD